MRRNVQGLNRNNAPLSQNAVNGTIRKLRRVDRFDDDEEVSGLLQAL